jgi:hypothetical protein
MPTGLEPMAGFRGSIATWVPGLGDSSDGEA